MNQKIEQYLASFGEAVNYIQNTKMFNLNDARKVIEGCESADLAVVAIEPMELVGETYFANANWVGEWYRPRGNSWPQFRQRCSVESTTHLCFVSREVKECKLVELFLICRHDWEDMDCDEVFLRTNPKWKQGTYPGIAPLDQEA